jgi:ethanolamine utilization protein EutQ
MPREVFTADDIRRLAKEQNSNLLVIGHADIITAEALDVAHSLGVKIHRAEAADSGAAALRALPPLGDPKPPLGDPKPPLKVVRGAGVTLDRFNNDNVKLKDVITTNDSSPMAAGYMTLDRVEFAWTLNYDEVDVVLEGELVITRGSEMVRAGVGDCIFIPKGSSITFGTPSHTRFMYIAFPANWSEQK